MPTYLTRITSSSTSIALTRLLKSYLPQSQEAKQNTGINRNIRYVMPRFYIDADLSVGKRITLPRTVVRHIHVLRLHTGDKITLFNGRGGEYVALLEAVMKQNADCCVEKFHEISRETPIWVGLAQAISSADKMDYNFQKGVEIGVSAFQPIAAERSIVKLIDERAEKRVARWQQIVISACEQSGRNSIPLVLPILSLEEWLLKPTEADARLILSVAGTNLLSNIASVPKRAWLMIGPEGGYSVREELAAMKVGWTLIKLGPRVLRTETAALAAVSAMQALWGDYC